MTPVRWDWDYLIHRHLEGGLEAEQARVLNARLAEDPGLQRRLAGMAFERAALAEPAADLVGAGPLPLLKPRGKTKRKKRRKNEGRRPEMN
jgi:anti-sigma factor RsiW